MAVFKLCTAWSSSLQSDGRALEVHEDTIALAGR